MAPRRSTSRTAGWHLRRWGALVALTIALVVVPMVVSHQLHQRKCQFDLAGWQASRADERQSTERYDHGSWAAEQLANCDELVRGHSRAQVLALLGHVGLTGRKTNSWSYDIGRPLELDSDWPPMDIAFGPSGGVDRVTVP
jgi:hypothetical protein